MKSKYSNLQRTEQIEIELHDSNFISDFSDDLFILMKRVLDPFEAEGYIYDINQSTVAGLYTKLFKCYKLIIEA